MGRACGDVFVKSVCVRVYVYDVCGGRGVDDVTLLKEWELLLISIQHRDKQTVTRGIAGPLCQTITELKLPQTLVHCGHAMYVGFKTSQPSLHC